ncbi:hypothetical protein B0H17DRAFT_1199093 [Mycena rosella]|uniref:Peptide hydrolase n=1 Tax=Mycena rosella TaxID=1033263 RepID=A0AAD7DM09_MYCRO|nr:hypothetical protein B0H17DRAFT_1199093 [Mycena rosella]
MKFASAFGVAFTAFAVVSAVPVTHDEITEDEKLELMRADTQFFGVTNTWEYKQARDAEVASKPTPIVTFPAPSKTSKITPLISQSPSTVAQSPATILGAHMDTINLNSPTPTSGRAPDTSCRLRWSEIFRVLMANGFAPSTPVAFHWYSGEDAGLQDIADGVVLKAFMKLDMTAYFKPGSAEQLIPLHSTLAVTTDAKCGYACSDRASWYGHGPGTAMLYAAVTGADNPVVHGAGDTAAVSGFSWVHSRDFASVCV